MNTERTERTELLVYPGIKGVSGKQVARLLLFTTQGLISQNSTYALKQWRMRIVEKNVKGTGHQSEQYQKVAQHRCKSAETNMVIAEGLSERGLAYSVKSE